MEWRLDVDVAVFNQKQPRKHVALKFVNFYVHYFQHLEQYSDSFAQQMGLRERRLPQHHSHPGALCCDWPWTQIMSLGRRFPSKVGAHQGNAADRLHLLRICRLHKFEPSKQHNRDLPGG